MRVPTMLRKKGTVHYAAVPVGARIARPRFVQHSLLLNDCMDVKMEPLQKFGFCNGWSLKKILEITQILL